MFSANAPYSFNKSRDSAPVKYPNIGNPYGHGPEASRRGMRGVEVEGSGLASIVYDLGICRSGLKFLSGTYGALPSP